MDSRMGGKNRKGPIMPTISRRHFVGLLGASGTGLAALSACGSTRVGTMQVPTWDCIVVGGGAAGMYSALKLQQKHPTWKIGVFEGSKRVGGRQYSIQTPGAPNVVAEMGAMRYIPATQPLVVDVIRELGLQSKPFGNGDKKNLLHLRGQRIKAGDLKIASKVPYRLHPTEEGLSPGGLMMKALMDYFPNALRTSSEEWVDIKKTAMIKGKYLYEHGFLDLIRNRQSADGFQLMMDGMGYTSFLANHNAAELFSMLSLDMPDDTGYRTVVGGFQQISLQLAAEFQKLGGIILKDANLQWVERFDTNPDGDFVLEFEDGIQHIQQHVAKKVVLAIPPTPLKKVMARSKTLRESFLASDIHALTAIPATKIHCAYETPWWQTLGIQDGYSKTTQSLRQCVYMGSEKDQPGGNKSNSNSLLLASYVDGFYSDYWKKYYHRNPEAGVDATKSLMLASHIQLQEMHGIQFKRPYWTSYINWDRPQFGGAWHFWKAGYDAQTTLPRLQNPLRDNRLMLAGEAYSHQNAWTAGALSSAARVVEMM